MQSYFKFLTFLLSLFQIIHASKLDTGTLKRLPNGNLFLSGSGCGSIKPMKIMKYVPDTLETLECVIFNVKGSNSLRDAEETGKKDFENHTIFSELSLVMFSKRDALNFPIRF